MKVKGIVLAMVILLTMLSGCTSEKAPVRKAAPSSSSSNSSKVEEATVIPQTEESAGSPVVKDEPKLPTKEVEETSEDGSASLKGDKYVKTILYSAGEAEYSLPAIRGELVSASEDGVIIYNSGVTMKVQVTEKASAEALTEVINEQISYHLDDDSIKVVFSLSDSHSAVYNITYGANADMVLYEKALEMFGIKL